MFAVIPAYLLLLILLLLPLAVLTGLWALCLKGLPKERRRGLLCVGAAMYALAGLLFGGAALLSLAGLTWRFVPVWVMSLALWGLGWGAGILTVCYTRRRMKEAPSQRMEWVTAGALFCLLCAMFLGTILGGLWLPWQSETVGEYEGRTVIQSGNGWDSGYDLYEYRGALVRPEEPFTWSEFPFLAEDSLRGVDGVLGLDLSAGTVTESRDTHGGFHGDGETFVAVRFGDDSLEEQLAGWQPLPLPDVLKDLRQQARNDAFPIPETDEGYYWVRDDQNKADPADGSHIFDGDRFSRNCALALYDRESRTLYYYRLDT